MYEQYQFKYEQKEYINMTTTIAQKFAALGTSIINLVGTRATVNMDNLTSAGEAKIAALGGGGGVSKGSISNVLLSVNDLTTNVVTDSETGLSTVTLSGTFKGMIPNGRYADGTLKSIEATVTLTNKQVYATRTHTLYAWGADSSTRIYSDVPTLKEDSPLYTSTGENYKGDAKYVINASANTIQYTSADGSTTSTLNRYESGDLIRPNDMGDVLYVFTDANGETNTHVYTVSFSQPAGGDGDVWYDMKNNKLKKYSTSQSAWQDYSAFLIAEIQVDYQGVPAIHVEEPLQILDAGVVIDKIEEAQVPTGTVIAYMGTDVPKGFLLMDGRTLSRNTYAKLFSVIGETQGAGDGSTTFQIADMTDGRYLMGSTVAGSSVVCWESPAIYSNGTMGGSTFAVQHNTSMYQQYDVYYAFDHDSSSQAIAYHNTITVSEPDIWTVYNPTPVNITSIFFKLRALDNLAAGVNSGFIQYSNGDGNWYNVYSFSNWGMDAVAGRTSTMHFPNNIFARFWRIYLTSVTGNGRTYVGFCEITLYGLINNHQVQLDELWVSKNQNNYMIKY